MAVWLLIDAEAGREPVTVLPPACSLFALFSFVGMLLCARVALGGAAGHSPLRTFFSSHALTLLLAAGTFALAGALRSNGLLLCAFIVHAAACVLRRLGPRVSVGLWLAWLAVTTLAVVVIAAPYVAFQFYGHFLYCDAAPASLRSWASAVGVLLPAAPLHPGRPWCPSSTSPAAPLIPQMYAFVQAKYWGVGLLRYFEPKQIPQFILAAPMIALAVSCARHVFFRKSSMEGVIAAATETLSLICALLGPFCPWTTPHADALPPATPAPLLAKSADGLPPPHRGTSRSPSRRQARPCSTPPPQPKLVLHAGLGSGALSPLASPEALPFVLYWIALVGVGVVLMHVQVTTRFVSSSPAVYWFLAHLWSGATQKVASAPAGRCSSCAPLTDVRSLSLAYALGYTLVGSTLFSAFHNWT